MSEEFTELEQFYSDDAYSGFHEIFIPERYQSYVDYVKEHMQGDQITELGSGTGGAAYALHKAGIQVTASDIFPENAKKSYAKKGYQIPVEMLNLNKISKPDNSVDNYCLYQVMEHIETPHKVLQEVFRTLKPGGCFIIVGPNLISPLANLKCLIMGILGRYETPWFRRHDGYHFPFGDTILENFFILFKNCYLTAIKLLFAFQRKAYFRKPCLKKPAFSDSDAALMLNPLDMREMLTSQGFVIHNYQGPKSHLGAMAGSTWLVAKKP